MRMSSFGRKCLRQCQISVSTSSYMPHIVIVFLLIRTDGIDTLAHEVIPRYPDIRPHDRMTYHFRFIAPLLPKDEMGLSALHYYDAGIQLAKYSSREPTEDEFVRCMAAAEQIMKMCVCFCHFIPGGPYVDLFLQSLEDCYAEMQMQDSSVSIDYLGERIRDSKA
jgi:hypothetical protein